MTLDELIKELKSRGYTQVITLGGPIPLETWDPYRMEGVNRFGDRHYQGEIIDGDRVRDIPRDGKIPEAPFVLCVWSFTR